MGTVTILWLVSKEVSMGDEWELFGDGIRTLDLFEVVP